MCVPPHTEYATGRTPVEAPGITTLTRARDRPTALMMCVLPSQSMRLDARPGGGARSDACVVWNADGYVHLFHADPRQSIVAFSFSFSLFLSLCFSTYLSGKLKGTFIYSLVGPCVQIFPEEGPCISPQRLYSRARSWCLVGPPHFHPNDLSKWEAISKRGKLRYVKRGKSRPAGCDSRGAAQSDACVDWNPDGYTLSLLSLFVGLHHRSATT